MQGQVSVVMQSSSEPMHVSQRQTGGRLLPPLVRFHLGELEGFDAAEEAVRQDTVLQGCE